MILPKILIYKDRLSLEEFHVEEEGGNKDLYETLLKMPDVVSDSNGDLEEQYLSIFNAAYYLCADMVRNKFPYMKMEEYRSYISSEVKGHYRKVDAVLCLTRALLLVHSTMTFRQRMKDTVLKQTGEFYTQFFQSLPVAFHGHRPEIPLDPPSITKEYLERNRKKLDWEKWTNGFSARGIKKIVMNVGVLKKEKMNLLEAIEEDAGKKGHEDALEIIVQLYDEVKKLEDVSSVPPKKYSLKEENEMLRRENERLNTECKQKDEHIHELKELISVLSQKPINVEQTMNFNADNIDQFNALVESGAQAIHTNKKTIMP